MRTHAIRVVCCLLGFGLNSICLAQLTDVEARRLGLEIAWRSHVQLPRTGHGLVSADLWVESTEPRKFAVVELDGLRIQVSADKLDRDGNPIGIEVAKQQATQQAARYVGKPSGFQVEELSVPRIKLVLVASDGLVQTLDAESGTLLWSSPCGLSTAPAHPAALSTAGITVIHGEYLYLLDWATGKRLKTQRLQSATSNAVAVCGDFAFVTDFGGGVATYSLQQGRLPWTYVMAGRAVGQPVSFKGQAFCAFASGEGYVYVFASGEEPSIWIRYETSAALTGSLTGGNNAVYVGTMGGALAKISVEQRLGSIDWEFRCGQPISAPALVVGESVFVNSQPGNVFALSDSNLGELKWSAAGHGVTQSIARTPENLICLTLSKTVMAFNAQTGAVVGRTPSLSLGGAIMNQTNDRVYIVTTDGRLQCLRSPSADLPVMVVPFLPSEAEVEQPASETESTPPAANENIFGSSASQPSAGGNVFAEDPFAGGLGGNAEGTELDNPFATPPSGDATADPFDNF